MKDPQIHPLGLFNISVFNRSDSDTRLRASISFAASTKTKGLDGFGCFVWNEEVLKGWRFYETGLTFFDAVEAVYFGQLTGLAQDQQFVRPQLIAVRCMVQSLQLSHHQFFPCNFTTAGLVE